MKIINQLFFFSETITDLFIEDCKDARSLRGQKIETIIKTNHPQRLVMQDKGRRHFDLQVVDLMELHRRVSGLTSHLYQGETHT